MAKALKVVGLMNVQFAIQGETVYVLEVNPRASRTVPFVSKATGLPLAKIAARCMAGQHARQQGVTREVVPPYFSVKEAVFPFIKFPGVDTILGPEMKSTGEVMGVGATFAEAFVKSQLAAGREAAAPAARCSSACATATRTRSVEIARDLAELGFSLVATRGTAAALAAAGLAVTRGEQGARRPAAHRRHDQERRNQPDRQHRRGQALAMHDSYAIRNAALQQRSPTTPRWPARAPPAPACSTCRSCRCMTCRTCTPGCPSSCIEPLH